jgi:hypothetical protein
VRSGSLDWVCGLNPETKPTQRTYVVRQKSSEQADTINPETGLEDRRECLQISILVMRLQSVMAAGLARTHQVLSLIDNKWQGCQESNGVQDDVGE